MRGAGIPVLAALVLVTACVAEAGAESRTKDASIERAPAPSEPGDPAAARAAVVELFAALRAKDCDATASLLDVSLRAKLEAESCADFMAEEPLVHAVVGEIGEARVDGRDLDTFLVTVSLVESGRTRALVVRVAYGAEGYRVLSL